MESHRRNSSNAFTSATVKHYCHQTGETVEAIGRPAKHEGRLRYPTMIHKPIKRVDAGAIGGSPWLLHLGEVGQIQLEVRFRIGGCLLYEQVGISVEKFRQKANGVTAVASSEHDSCLSQEVARIAGRFCQSHVDESQRLRIVARSCCGMRRTG